MKMIMVTLVFLCYIALSNAQDVFSNKVNSTLEKVIRDYPHRFHNIKGELIMEGSKITQYQSMVQLPGATSCLVTRHKEGNREVYSWSCTAVQSADFNLAKNKFREIFGQIENTIIKIEGEKSFILNGQYETPLEDRKLTTVRFELLPAVGEIKKLKVELSLLNETNAWKVSIAVLDHDEREEGEGSLTGN